MVGVAALFTSTLLLGNRVPCMQLRHRVCAVRPSLSAHQSKLARTNSKALLLPALQSTASAQEPVHIVAEVANSYDTLLKAAAIGALVMQNTGLAVAMRLSKIGRDPSEVYISSTAVVLSEAIKVMLVLLFRWNERRHEGEKQDTLAQEVRSYYTIALDIPVITFSSALYVVQNNLQYIATSCLPAAVYQVSVQMKIVATALATFVVFKRALTSLQWVSVILLIAGTIMVKLSTQPSKAVADVNMELGLAAVALTCITSAIAGVTQEKALKNGKLTLWARNTQICTVSLGLAIMMTALKDGQLIVQKGFFHGYSPLVVGVILLQAVGGLLVSIVVKQTDTVMKGFASSGSILLSCLVSLFFLQDVQPSVGLLLGAILVCLATVGYARGTLKPPAPAVPVAVPIADEADKEQGTVEAVPADPLEANDQCWSMSCGL